MQGNEHKTSRAILYVEDHQDSSEVFSRALQYAGYAVHVASDWKSAIQLACRIPFDLLLCEIGLPDGDGCDLLQILRATSENTYLRGIAFSALGAAGDIDRIQEAGFDGHVLKPVEVDELVRVIEKVFRQQPAHDQPFVFSLAPRA